MSVSLEGKNHKTTVKQHESHFRAVLVEPKEEKKPDLAEVREVLRKKENI